MKTLFSSTLFACVTVISLNASMEETAIETKKSIQTRIARTPSGTSTKVHKNSQSRENKPLIANSTHANSSPQQTRTNQNLGTDDLKKSTNIQSNEKSYIQNEIPPSQVKQAEIKKLSSEPRAPEKFGSFTGKVKGTRVRVRLVPTLDGAVVGELNKDDMVVVDSETEDYYAIQPPSNTKAYIYRTYVLDNVIEGNRVNARLYPDLDAPIVTQFNSGDKVEGTIAPGHHKWLEINFPPTARFYVAKEFVEKAGDAGMKSRLEKKHLEGIQQLSQTEGIARAEMQKPFEQIEIENIKTAYHHLINDYPEFPEIGTKAKDTLTAFLEDYSNNKLTYLENQTLASSVALEKNKKLTTELQVQKDKIDELQHQLEQNQSDENQSTTPQQTTSYKAEQLPIHMAEWCPAEDGFISKWAESTGNHSPKDFYEDQKKHGFTLRGVVDTYNKPIKNKPGNFMLLNPSSKLPIAFLYSTTVNLQHYLNHEVTMFVVPRPNNNFAFPAYFVVQLE